MPPFKVEPHAFHFKPGVDVDRLNIKNDETCRLAGELTRLTGETMTGAITVSLRERLAHEKRRHDATVLARELNAVGQRRIVRPLPGRSAGGPYPAEVGQVVLDCGGQFCVQGRHDACCG